MGNGSSSASRQETLEYLQTILSIRFFWCFWSVIQFFNKSFQIVKLYIANNL